MVKNQGQVQDFSPSIPYQFFRLFFFLFSFSFFLYLASLEELGRGFERSEEKKKRKEIKRREEKREEVGLGDVTSRHVTSRLSEAK